MIHVSNLTYPKVCSNCRKQFNANNNTKGFALFCCGKCEAQSRYRRERDSLREPGQSRKPHSRHVGVLYAPTLESGLVDSRYLSRILNCTRATIYNRIRRGLIPPPLAATMPLKWRISEIKEWYERLKTTTTEGQQG